jgi:SAM-dependent methyltransferase
MSDPHERLREFWDQDAATYDRAPGHGLTDPTEAAAWRAALLRHLPPPPARILDVGAGTGAMSVLAAELGYRVTALDLSPEMLERARGKADHLDLDIDTVVGAAVDPPEGPFDAVMERHLLWTTPDPVQALTAWKTVVPEGRLVLFESLIARGGAGERMRSLAAAGLKRAMRTPPEHHGEYDPALLSSLPLARAATLRPMLESVEEAGWRRIRLERLRDVEWARRSASPLLGRLQEVPRFAIVADSG